MPFINPFGFAPNVTTKTTKGTGSGASNHSAVTNPRAAAPQQPTFAATDTTWVYTDQKSLGASLTQGFTIQLPQQSITEIDLSQTLTITGTVSNTGIDVATSIDHIEFYDGDSGQQISSIPGGTYLYDHLVRFYPVKGAYTGYSGSALSNAVGTTATSATAVLRIPVQIPAPATSPHKMIIYYATLATAAGSATSCAISNDIQVKYGDAPNGWLCIRAQTLSLVNGTNFLNQLAIPANVPVAELFLRTGTTSSITSIQILTGSTTVVPTQKTAFVFARDAADFGTALQAQTLVLDLGTTFAIGPTSQFYLVTSGAITTEQLVWAWFSG